MNLNIILAGVGGQGILTIAQAVSIAAMRRGWTVKQAEVHGMSQRGGAVYSHLRLSDRELFSDLIPRGECDLILAMEPMEALRYVEYLRTGGAIVSSTCPFVNISNYPAVEELLDRIVAAGEHVLLDAERLARAVGSGLAGNSALLGGASHFLGMDAVELEDALAEMFQRKGQRIIDANQRAFRLGRHVATVYRNGLERGALPRALRQGLSAVTPNRLPDADLLEDILSGAQTETALSAAEVSAVGQILESAAAGGRSQLFEHEVYRIVELVGAISSPRHHFIPNGELVKESDLERLGGTQVVLKLVSTTVVHKSDVGAVQFVARDLDLVNREIARMIERHASREAPVEGVLLVEYVETQRGGFGGELFVGFRASREFGPVIAAGIGGIDTEYLAQHMKPGIAVAKALAVDAMADQFLALFQATAAYDVLAGRARGHQRLVSDGQLLRCFRAFIALARHFCVDRGDSGPHLLELEVNPFGFTRQRMIPLDGRGRMGSVVRAVPARPLANVERLLEPASIALVGVSADRVNFGRVILANVLACGYPKRQVRIVKSGASEIDGVACVGALKDLPGRTDLVVAAVPAENVPALVDQVLEAGNVNSLILIPGGLGETESSSDLQEQVRRRILESHLLPGGGVVVLGGNCLGVRCRPGRYDTFFVPREKLALDNKQPPHPTALITQSGAFAITRLSNWQSIRPAIAVTIGNQIDITAGDLLRVIAARDDIRVIGVYMEGFNDLDGLEFVRAVSEACHPALPRDRSKSAAPKTVIFYKAGRTAPGRSATAGHTASIAGDYEVCQSAVAQAGAMVVDTFKEFEQLVELATLFDGCAVAGRRIGVISNAGFETVGMADTIQGPRYQVELAALCEHTEAAIRAALAERKLDHLINIRNPLDVNPMSDEGVYEACARAMLEDPQVDALVVSIVPFTPQLCTTPRELAHGSSLADSLPELARRYGKPLITVVDAGPPYDQFAQALRRKGLPVFPSCDQAVRSLGRYLDHFVGEAKRRPAANCESAMAATAVGVDASV